MLSAKDARNLMAPDANVQVEILSDDISQQATNGSSSIILTGDFWGFGPNGAFPKTWNESVGILTRLGYIVIYDEKGFLTKVSW